jgi:hypothetical protein
MRVDLQRKPAHRKGYGHLEKSVNYMTRRRAQRTQLRWKRFRLVKRTRLPVSYYETILKIIFKSRIAVVNQKQSGLCHATHGMIMTLFCRAWSFGKVGQLYDETKSTTYAVAMETE